MPRTERPPGAGAASLARERRLSRSFGGDVDVIAYEFENVPAETATFLAARKPVLPDPRVLAVTQDRLAEKDFVVSLGIATAPYAAAASERELVRALSSIGRPAVLKTRRFGYDGKGQATMRSGDDAGAAWAAVGGPRSLRAYVPFGRKSMVAARGGGKIRCLMSPKTSTAAISSRFRFATPPSSRRSPRRRAASPAGSPRHSAMSACLRSRCSWLRTAQAIP